jgi:alginate O-acetyltransferase complex protein AlgI
MNFISPRFLFLLLPITLIIFYLSKIKNRPLVIISISSIFYIFNNPTYLPLVISLTLGNFVLGKQIHAKQDDPKHARRLLTCGIILNAFLLLCFKYLISYGSNYLVGLLPEQIGQLVLDIVLPLGFSYITFQNISYLFDVNNEICLPETNFWDFLIYTIFFPKILIGPIMRYPDMVTGIKAQRPDVKLLAKGIRRFILGLAKKVLIADTIARAINPSFSLESPEFSAGIAWFMLSAYAVQLYYDFSGLTDMALGMGLMFGIPLTENFNYPYIAQNISDFWRRWHISLSSWVRDYIFTPLEFKRRRVKFARQQTNIIIAFFIMGIWHGLTPNFILWGLFNGIFLAIEMTFFSKLLKKLWTPIRHIYALSIILIGWIIFRSNSLSYCFAYIKRLLGLGEDYIVQPFTSTEPLPIIENTVWIALIVGIIFAIQLIHNIVNKWMVKIKRESCKSVLLIVKDLLLVSLLILSFASIASTQIVGDIYAGF